jgi:hypothetical protein
MVICVKNGVMVFSYYFKEGINRIVMLIAMVRVCSNGNVQSQLEKERTQTRPPVNEELIVN